MLTLFVSNILAATSHSAPGSSITILAILLCLQIQVLSALLQEAEPAVDAATPTPAAADDEQDADEATPHEGGESCLAAVMAGTCVQALRVTGVRGCPLLRATVVVRRGTCSPAAVERLSSFTPHHRHLDWLHSRGVGLC
ncbi:hypothetical protein C8J57DRAFT_1537897 [Mycena rebaudengoi]|nr:hypothetical protein C8J57DRAFT_1537897 [Mycena rebaudengoi]